MIEKNSIHTLSPMLGKLASKVKKGKGIIQSKEN